MYFVCILFVHTLHHHPTLDYLSVVDDIMEDIQNVRIEELTDSIYVSPFRLTYEQVY